MEKRTIHNLSDFPYQYVTTSDEPTPITTNPTDSDTSDTADSAPTADNSANPDNSDNADNSHKWVTPGPSAQELADQAIRVQKADNWVATGKFELPDNSDQRDVTDEILDLLTPHIWDEPETLDITLVRDFQRIWRKENDPAFRSDLLGWVNAVHSNLNDSIVRFLDFWGIQYEVDRNGMKSDMLRMWHNLHLSSKAVDSSPKASFHYDGDMTYESEILDYSPFEVEGYESDDNTHILTDGEFTAIEEFMLKWGYSGNVRFGDDLVTLYELDDIRDYDIEAILDEWGIFDEISRLGMFYDMSKIRDMRNNADEPIGSGAFEGTTDSSDELLFTSRPTQFTLSVRIIAILHVQLEKGKPHFLHI